MSPTGTAKPMRPAKKKYACPFRAELLFVTTSSLVARTSITCSWPCLLLIGMRVSQGLLIRMQPGRGPGTPGLRPGGHATAR